MSSEVSSADRSNTAKAKGARRLQNRLWTFAACLVSAILLVALILCLAVYPQAMGRAILRSELAAIAASGDPITTSEMAEWYKVPPGERDITSLWITALKPFDTPSFSASAVSLPYVGNADIPVGSFEEPLAAADEKAMRDFLLLHRDKLAAIYAVADEPGEVRYPRDFRQGALLFGTEVQQIRVVVRTLNLEFEVLAREKNLDPAIENLKAQFAVAETLRHEPVQIGIIIRISLHRMSFDNIRRLAETGNLTDKQLARLQDMVRAIDIHAQLPNVIVGERATCYHTFHQLLSVTWAPIDGGTDIVARETTHDFRDVERPEDCAMAMRLLTGLKEAAHSPTPEMLREMWRFDEMIEDLKGEGTSFNGKRYAMTTSLLSELRYIAFADAEGEALRDLTDTALAARRYQLQHGHAPVTLSDLVPNFLPKLPLDSFDGQPLRLKPQADGVLLYCVGKDCRDDGGYCDPAKREPDIAVEVKLPK